MTFSTIIRGFADPVSAFATSNPLIAVAALIVLAFFIYRRPLLFFIVFLVGLLIVGALYFIMGASGSGVAVKERMIRQEGAPQSSCGQSGLLF